MGKGKPIKNYQEREQKTEYAFKYYLNKGYTPEQSSAIVGNLLRESGLNPNAVGDSGKAFGLAQWHPDRQEKAKALYGDKWTDFDNQLAFVDWELNNTEIKAGQALKKAKTAWKAGEVFTDLYERPKVKFVADNQRQDFVVNTYTKHGGMELTDEDKQMFTPTNNISYLPQTEINTTFVPTPQVNIDYLKEIEQVAQVPQQEEQITTEEDNFMQDILSKVMMGVEYVKPVERDIMESGGKIPVSTYGVYAYPRQEVLVPTKNGEITMENVSYPILGTDEYGNSQMMYPNKNYKFQGKLIHEQPQ